MNDPDSDAALFLIVGAGLLLAFRERHGLPVWATVALAIVAVTAATILTLARIA